MTSFTDSKQLQQDSRGELLPSREDRNETRNIGKQQQSEQSSFYEQQSEKYFDDNVKKQQPGEKSRHC